jgi:nitrilase
MDYPFEIKKFKVAAIQASPVILSKEGCIEKCCKLTEEAAGNGARIVVFPETFIPTYPYWTRDLPDRSGCYDSYVKLFKNSIKIPSKDTEKLGEVAKKTETYMVIGVNELDSELQGTLYNTNLVIGKDGRVLGKHRKLLPTFSERMIHGQGDGSTMSVFNTEYGKLGTLVCYEHHMPLTKYCNFAMGEQIHAACWPGLPWINNVVDVSSRQYAFEGQVFVIASAGYATKEMLPDDFMLKEYFWPANGGSGIISPLGNYLAGPIYDKEEILYAEIDMELIIRAKYIFDTVGHYARWDVLSLCFNDEKYAPFKQIKNIRGLNKDALGELKEVQSEMQGVLQESSLGEFKLAINDLKTQLKKSLSLRKEK